MNELTKNPVRKTNRLAVTSLVTGSISFVFPILVGILYFVKFSPESFPVHSEFMETVISYAYHSILFNEIAAILCGVISFVSGDNALKQIKKNGHVQKEYAMAHAGMVLGAFGVFLNILMLILAFIFILFLGWMSSAWIGYS